MALESHYQSGMGSRRGTLFGAQDGLRFRLCCDLFCSSVCTGGKEGARIRPFSQVRSNEMDARLRTHESGRLGLQILQPISRAEQSRAEQMRQKQLRGVGREPLTFLPASLGFRPCRCTAPPLLACHPTQSPGHGSAGQSPVKSPPAARPQKTQELGQLMVKRTSSTACTLWRMNTHVSMHTNPPCTCLHTLAGVGGR